MDTTRPLMPPPKPSSLHIPASYPSITLAASAPDTHMQTLPPDFSVPEVGMAPRRWSSKVGPRQAAVSQSRGGYVSPDPSPTSMTSPLPTSAALPLPSHAARPSSTPGINPPSFAVRTHMPISPDTPEAGIDARDNHLGHDHDLGHGNGQVRTKVQMNVTTAHASYLSRTSDHPTTSGGLSGADRADYFGSKSGTQGNNAANTPHARVDQPHDQQLYQPFQPQHQHPLGSDRYHQQLVQPPRDDQPHQPQRYDHQVQHQLHRRASQQHHAPAQGYNVSAERGGAGSVGSVAMARVLSTPYQGYPTQPKQPNHAGGSHGGAGVGGSGAGLTMTGSLGMQGGPGVHKSTTSSESDPFYYPAMPLQYPPHGHSHSHRSFSSSFSQTTSRQSQSQQGQGGQSGQGQGQGRRGSRRGSKKTDGKSQTFLPKLYQILSEPEYVDIIRWDDTGSTIIIERPDELTEKILPLVFRQSRFASFSRQLNIYGFMRKVSLRHLDREIVDPDASTWSHPFLRRDSTQAELESFKRRVPPRPSQAAKRRASIMSTNMHYEPTPGLSPTSSEDSFSGGNGLSPPDAYVTHLLSDVAEHRPMVFGGPGASMHGGLGGLGGMRALGGPGRLVPTYSSYSSSPEEGNAGLYGLGGDRGGAGAGGAGRYGGGGGGNAPIGLGISGLSQGESSLAPSFGSGHTGNTDSHALTRYSTSDPVGSTGAGYTSLTGRPIAAPANALAPPPFLSFTFNPPSFLRESTTNLDSTNSTDSANPTNSDVTAQPIPASAPPDIHHFLPDLRIAQGHLRTRSVQGEPPTATIGGGFSPGPAEVYEPEGNGMARSREEGQWMPEYLGGATLQRKDAGGGIKEEEEEMRCEMDEDNGKEKEEEDDPCVVKPGTPIYHPDEPSTWLKRTWTDLTTGKPVEPPVGSSGLAGVDIPRAGLGLGLGLGGGRKSIFDKAYLGAGAGSGLGAGAIGALGLGMPSTSLPSDFAPLPTYVSPTDPPSSAATSTFRPHPQGGHSHGRSNAKADLRSTPVGGEHATVSPGIYQAGFSLPTFRTGAVAAPAASMHDRRDPGIGVPKAGAGGGRAVSIAVNRAERRASISTSPYVSPRSRPGLSLGALPVASWRASGSTSRRGSASRLGGAGEGGGGGKSEKREDNRMEDSRMEVCEDVDEALPSAGLVGLVGGPFDGFLGCGNEGDGDGMEMA